MCALAEALREEGHDVTIVTNKFPGDKWKGIPIARRGSSSNIYDARFLADVLSEMAVDGSLTHVSSQFMLSTRKPYPRGQRRRPPSVGVVHGPLYGTRQLARRMLNPLLVPDIAIDVPHLASWFSRTCGSWANYREYVNHLTFVWKGDMAAAILAGVGQADCSVFHHPFEPFFLNFDGRKEPVGIMSRLPSAQRRVIFAGPEEFSRGLHLAKALIDHLSPANPTQVLILVRDFSRLNPAITTRMRGKHSCVIVRGVLSREEMRDAFGRSTIGLFPYLFVRSAIPLVLLEAVATGLTVVTSPAYPLSELAEDTGLQFVDPNDPKRIASTLEGLLGDEERLAQIRRRNLEWIGRTPPWREIARTLVEKIKVAGDQNG